jgi:hypothetical protein
MEKATKQMYMMANSKETTKNSKLYIRSKTMCTRSKGLVKKKIIEEDDSDMEYEDVHDGNDKENKNNYDTKNDLQYINGK